MTRRTLAWSATLGGAAIFILAACSSSSASAGASAANGTSGAPSVGAPSVAAPSGATSAAPLASAGEPGASLAIPSFELPSDDKGLEALLPDQMCGKAATKLSFSGDRFGLADDPTLSATLAKIGKTPKDVSFAVSAGPFASGGDCSTSAAVFRVKGVDGGLLRDAVLAEVGKDAQAATQSNVGGKDVYVWPSEDGDSKTYAYFKGDAIFFVVAKDDAAAGPVLQVMP